MQNKEEIKPLKPKRLNEQTYKSISNQNRINKMFRTEKFILFSILVFGILTLGIATALFGLSLNELSYNINATIAQLSYGIFLKFIFSCSGSLAAFYLLDKWNLQLTFGFYNIIFGLVSFIFPLCTSFNLYLFISALQGFLLPFLNTIPNVWIIELFGDSSKIYLQIYYFFYPVGQMVAPIMTAPFLADYKSNVTYQSISSNQTNYFDNLFITTTYSKLWIPYLIATVFNLFCGFLVFGTYLIKPYEKPIVEEKKLKETDVFKDAKKYVSKNYSIIFVTLICLITGIQLTNEMNAISFLPAYLTRSDSLKLDPVTAAYCQGILSLSTIAGRLINILLTFKINIQSMIFINFLSMMLGNWILVTIGSYSLTGVYIGSILLGYGFSNAFVMMIAFVEERISLNNRVMALITFSAGIFIAISSVALGKFMDSNPLNYINLNLGATFLAFFAYTILFVLEQLRLSRKI